ncbi:PREDICTED: cuticle protein 19.8-like [Dinoponera quadriceps]|uniref:Cuticle protein 19.8-like n=1 Tax=Dinoponera quadriceps TaxID=609295 RepID=A0A6P3WNR9_DINQU|nr:PREDICTED: cuticle protein 19.8-like [Dinoponera quadriceps]
MLKLCILAVLLAAVSVAPAPAPGALLAVPAPIVTASSSQYVARNYNTLAAAPLVAAPFAPLAAAAPIAAAPLAYNTHAVAPAAYSAAYSPSILLLERKIHVPRRILEYYRTDYKPDGHTSYNMFKLLCFFAFLALATAAPAPAPAPGAIIGAPLVTSYSAPIVSAPLAYSAYSLPTYSAYSAYSALPYAYKSYAAYIA